MTTTHEYLTPDMPEAFAGLTKQRHRHCYLPASQLAECPMCHAYGGWILRPNAYGPGQHFMAHCLQCRGWGWVEQGTADAACAHEYKEISYLEAEQLGIPHQGMFHHVLVCTKCGTSTSCDSD
jgi:hypothetical protein